MLRFIQSVETEPLACLAPAPEIIDEPTEVEGNLLCEADSDCSSNSHCGDNGICVSNCTSSDECSDGEVCNSDGRCVSEEDIEVTDEGGSDGGDGSSDADAAGCGCSAGPTTALPWLAFLLILWGSRTIRRRRSGSV